MMRIVPKRFEDLRFLQLAVFVLVLLLANAIFPHGLLIRSLVALMFLNTLFVTLSAVGHGPRVRGALFVVWAIATLCMAWGEFYAGARFGWLAVFSGQSAYLFLVMTGVVATFRYVITTRRASLDTIFASVVAYLLIGLGFTLLYTILLGLDPQAFNVADRPGFDEHAALPAPLVYFSFVTIATLGYGDITAQLPLPQILAALEAVIGQFYIAIVVAWLVSRFVMETNPDSETPPANE
jgi:voltage-gated potassium channel